MDAVHRIHLEQTFDAVDSSPLAQMQRPCPDVPAVACHVIPDVAILDQKLNLLDLDIVKAHLLNEGRLSVKQVEKILNDGDTSLRSEPNVLEINTKCYIFGDIHGQFYDLVSLLNLFDLKTQTLLFLGDYVDRGQFSVETYLYLMLLKAHYPKNLYILRGNHESEKMTSYFTFKAECLSKYNISVYDRFVRSFKMLPIAAVVQGKAFCAHGGISPHIKHVSEINTIDRFREIVYSGLFCDVFWSDPHEHYDLGMGASWEYNDRRRCSVKFTYENVKRFLDNNNLSMVIRAHEVQETGCRLMKSYRGHPSVVTVFSAPSYCDAYQNDGAYIEFDMGIVAINRYKAVAHPFVINGFFNAINWSLPFVSEKLVELALALFTELDREDILDVTDVLVSGMALMRTEREAIDEFEKDESLECGLLSTVENDMEFDDAKKKDAENEMMKSKEERSEITAEVSPSMQTKSLGEVGRELNRLGIENAEKVVSKVEVAEESDKEKIAVKRETKKNMSNRVCRFLCGK